jgi:hypothetical protein
MAVNEKAGDFRPASEKLRSLVRYQSKMIFVLTFVSALGCGLVAGIFFTFSNFVMKSLARLSPAQGIAAMQTINADVLNRWFSPPSSGLHCVASSSLFRRYLDGINPARSTSSSAVCSISWAQFW